MSHPVFIYSIILRCANTSFFLGRGPQPMVCGSHRAHSYGPLLTNQNFSSNLSTVKKYHYNCRFNSLIFSFQKILSQTFLLATSLISLKKKQKKKHVLLPTPNGEWVCLILQTTVKYASCALSWQLSRHY